MNVSENLIKDQWYLSFDCGMKSFAFALICIRQPPLTALRDKLAALMAAVKKQDLATARYLTNRDFDDLVGDIMENPERIYDKNISAEQILKLQRHLNPYSYIAKNANDTNHKRQIAASFTNLRADYIRRFVMTSLVGFLFRMAEEWEVPATLCNRTPNSAEKKKVQPDELFSKVEKMCELIKLTRDAFKEADTLMKPLSGNQDDLKALKAADIAVAKARGLQYATIVELRSLGIDADHCIDDLATVARQHSEIKEIIDNHPIKRNPNWGEVTAEKGKEIIMDFLRSWFEYNPDAHVRKAYDDVKTTPTESSSGQRVVDSDDPKRIPLAVIRAIPKIDDETDRLIVKELTSDHKTFNAAALMLRDEQAARALIAALNSPEKFRHLILPISEDSDARPAVDIIPPPPKTPSTAGNTTWRSTLKSFALPLKRFIVRSLI